MDILEFTSAIRNLDKIILTEDEFIFHAGTKIEGSKVFSNGGRVLNFVAKSDSFKESREIALNLIKKINYDLENKLATINRISE